jgi:hypothetical protein
MIVRHSDRVVTLLQEPKISTESDLCDGIFCKHNHSLAVVDEALDDVRVVQRRVGVRRRSVYRVEARSIILVNQSPGSVRNDVFPFLQASLREGSGKDSPLAGVIGLLDTSAR